jgi:di/tricarboxylate transporter
MKTAHTSETSFSTTLCSVSSQRKAILIKFVFNIVVYLFGYFGIVPFLESISVFNSYVVTLRVMKAAAAVVVIIIIIIICDTCNNRGNWNGIKK